MLNVQNALLTYAKDAEEETGKLKQLVEKARGVYVLKKEDGYIKERSEAKSQVITTYVC